MKKKLRQSHESRLNLYQFQVQKTATITTTQNKH